MNMDEARAWAAGPDASAGVVNALIGAAASPEPARTDMTRDDRLTDADRRTISEARVLARLSGPEAVREATGDEDTAMAYVVAFGRAQFHLRDLLAIVDRLGGAFCRRCRRGTTSVPCPKCGGPACAVCGRCPPCDGDLPEQAG